MASSIYENLPTALTQPEVWQAHLERLTLYDIEGIIRGNELGALADVITTMATEVTRLRLIVAKLEAEHARRTKT